jgi:hypothetical protein
MILRRSIEKVSTIVATRRTTGVPPIVSRMLS